MFKKLLAGLIVASLALPLAPSTGLCWYGGPPRYYHHSHGGDGWVWGLGGLVLGSALVAATMQPTREVVYVEPQPTYTYVAPPRSCRWERYVLDGYGRTMYDRYGQPIKEYTTGPCDTPPPW